VGHDGLGIVREASSMTASDQVIDILRKAEVKKFYQFLADWEQQHLNALQGLCETIRGDFWEKSGFSPY
jgi:rubrerythrin